MFFLNHKNFKCLLRAEHVGNLGLYYSKKGQLDPGNRKTGKKEGGGDDRVSEQQKNRETVKAGDWVLHKHRAPTAPCDWWSLALRAP